ncbi:hypothetical protein Anapl_12065 [Anas platyrhynchos]|uniref:Uncharacterized protein n=1 Tax=Anas platyrhynchos TaxID=8839 RepID=R0L5V1_ANAPL|nr:hypothetical protein Anapl_12065 [Anas platyrhynchos]
MMCSPALWQESGDIKAFGLCAALAVGAAQRKEKEPLFKGTTPQGQGTSHVSSKLEKRSQTHPKDQSLPTQ